MCNFHKSFVTHYSNGNIVSLWRCAIHPKKQEAYKKPVTWCKRGVLTHPKTQMAVTDIYILQTCSSSSVKSASHFITDGEGFRS